MGKMFAFFFFGCGSLEKSQKLEPAKISCHTVSLVYLNFVCFVESSSPFLKTVKDKKTPEGVYAGCVGVRKLPVR